MALSTQPIDSQKVAESIVRAYAIAGIQRPQIIFCDSPYAAFRYTSQEQPSWGQPTNLLGEGVSKRLTKQINSQLFTQLSSQLREELLQELHRMNKPEDQQLLCNLPVMSWDLWAPMKLIKQAYLISYTIKRDNLLGAIGSGLVALAIGCSVTD